MSKYFNGARYDIPFPINCGERNAFSKLKTDRVKLIISLGKINLSKRKIAKILNISETIIRNIINNKSWCHIDRSKIEPYVNFMAEKKLEKLEL